MWDYEEIARMAELAEEAAMRERAFDLLLDKCIRKERERVEERAWS
ncbi:MAG: hypothetical protein IJ087_01265 [Eggerthellaceae bacterium]|nr:hypothetical protein [Eggerthellaceae bacterium]